MNNSVSSSSLPHDGPEQLEGFALYFPDDEYNANDPKVAITRILCDFFVANAATYLNVDEVHTSVLYHRLAR